MPFPKNIRISVFPETVAGGVSAAVPVQRREKVCPPGCKDGPDAFVPAVFSVMWRISPRDVECFHGFLLIFAAAYRYDVENDCFVVFVQAGPQLVPLLMICLWHEKAGKSRCSEDKLT